VAEENEDKVEERETGRGRSVFTRRNLIIASGIAAIALVLIALLVYVSYRAGVFDDYIKGQFVAKMADIGIEFTADRFHVAASPLELVLENATFNDKLTGEKLFFIRSARLGLTVQDLFAWRTSRDITIDRSEIRGAEVWIKFDENGRSNFDNLRLIEDERGSAVNFKYESAVIDVQDSVIHFGDLSRRISANATNLAISMAPNGTLTAEGRNRYAFDISSTDGDFAYDDRKVDDIDVRIAGIADDKGAEIQRFTVNTPLGELVANGLVTDWANPRYDLNVESTVDLTQTALTFATGTALRGTGNFRGRLSGQGETYRIEGSIDSDSLMADGVYLKAVNLEATVEGTNQNYEANGNAVAEMLTFEDFQINWLKLAGNVRGSGTDFRWVGELQAAAAKTKGLTIAGLFLADAAAEYKDKELSAYAGDGRAKRLDVGDLEFADLRARSLRFSTPGGNLNLTANSATTSSLVAEDYRLNGVAGQNVRIRDFPGGTDVSVSSVRARSATIAGANVEGLTASRFDLRDRPATTDVDLTNVSASRVEAEGTVVSGVDAPSINIADTAESTIVYANRSRVARIDTGSAVLGNLNIAGIRLSIRNGTVEGRSDDIDAGDIALNRNSSLASGGKIENVRFNKPVFVVERSGRYRASADMSIGGGTIGSIALGAATASVVVNNQTVSLNNLVANVMEGSVNGAANIALDGRSPSRIDASFTSVDLSKLVALQSGRVMPFDGTATGSADLTFRGTDIRTTSGTLTAAITANAGTEANGTVPVNGNIDLIADNGLFTIRQAQLRTENSELNASGRFDLKDDQSNLSLALRSTNASEIKRVIDVTGILPDVSEQMNSLDAELAGNLTFDGTVTGNLYDPLIEGRAALDSLILKQRDIGSLAANISRTPLGLELTNGRLSERAGGSADFSISIPTGGTNNVSVKATLNSVNAGNLLAALPISLPGQLRDFNGRTSGTVDITGLPRNATGAIDLTAANGTVAGQSFDGLAAKATFSGSRINLESGEIRFGAGRLSATGNYDTSSSAFNFDVTGDQVPVGLVLGVLPSTEALPPINGTVNLTAKATGEADRPETLNISFQGTGAGVTIAENQVGDVTFSGATTNQVLTAQLAANLGGRRQTIDGTINFADESLPISVRTVFDQSPLAPYVALIPQLKGLPVDGVATGTINFGGYLRRRNDAGELVTDSSNLSGSAEFTQLSVAVEGAPLAAVEPVRVRFTPQELVIENARFAGSGSNITVTGTKAFTESGSNNLSIDGRINLNLLNLATTDTFFAGLADVSVRLVGPNSTARLTGTASTENASVAAFIGSDRLTLDRIKTRIIFTTNQAEIEEMSGYLGGGKFTASGGALLRGLDVDTFRIALNGDNVTVPLPQDFITTGDAQLDISGIRQGRSGGLLITIAGRVLASRSLYTRDIDLANILTSRPERSISSGPSTMRPPRFDIVIEGRDALVVRNNIADLTASVSLVLTGDANRPRLTGRITATGGTLLYRKDRYEVQRGVLEFPPETTEIDPIINLQAETEIAGYQIFVNLAGRLSDTEQLQATVRSSPALPSDDVVSLITTGNLSNTAGGIPTLAQTGINTAAEILTDQIFSNPIRKATDKLFGLNVFEIDPLISGQTTNPTARLTVGRQINNNLRVTYATNLSQDRNQVLALEYRVSNKLSFVAQYEQASLSNVTRRRDNFSFEIRFRRRF
jgi:translocation and assembly module TamB